ncbi:MAG: 4Fe-4S dicluster domain-containing protein [Promethearchaeota archaeon]|nr:MAG: 4Fe-4S dicluster domain-containing protein [Candidatus Lokiarchaeota archaeon]
MDCKACDKSCPMDIKVSEYIQKGLRITSSECIICLNCVKVCPNDVLTTSNSIDKKFPEFINYAQ